MSYNFLKKNKPKINYFIIFLIVVTIFNYIFQISYVDKIYSLNLSLKKKDNFKINELAFTSKTGKEGLSVAVVGQTIEKYERKVELKMQEKINFEINYDKDLIQISKVCKKLRITVKGKYYFINCQTSNAEESTKKIFKSLENVLEKILNKPEINLIKIGLNKLDIDNLENKNNNLIIIDKNIYYTRNIIKNIFILDGVLIIIFIIYMFNIRKINKIFS